MKISKLLSLVALLILITAGYTAGGQAPNELNKLLLQAATKYEVEQLKSLLANGANVNAQDNFGQTTLHHAAVKGHESIVALLLTNGASVDPRDNAGRTPLHYATGAGFGRYGVEGGSVDIAQLLLDEGANINVTDRVGWTPLHYAAYLGMLWRKVDMVELLVNRGADMDIVDNRGRTALSLAQGMLYHLHGRENEPEFVRFYHKMGDLLSKEGCTYYVATDGNDLYPGTLLRPFKTLDAAVSIVEPGYTIFVRGGIYICPNTIHIDKSGQRGNPIYLRAYYGESPVFDFSTAKNDGFLITGAYWHIKGLAVTKAENFGLTLETKGAHNNILEQIKLYANSNAALVLRIGIEHNIVLNCDSYRNFDPHTNGENADGFGAFYDVGEGNIFIGCRAWNNSDDGFDSASSNVAVRLENCFTWRNGENIWGHPYFTGNANGFKLGAGNHLLIRCVAWDHPARGFTVQRAGTGVTLYNCTALQNRINYQVIRPLNLEKNILRNCFSFRGGIRMRPDVDDKHNSWNESLGLVITEHDFLSLSDSFITGVRNPDGSLPESNFLRLAPGSDAIDAGVDVGLPFVGKAPDLGAFEHNPAENGKRSPNMLHQAVRDHDIKKIRKMLAEGTDVNEKDWLGYAPLHWAIYFGYADVAEMLISEGANSNLLSDTGRKPGEIAKAMEYDNLAELLRKHGAEK